MSINHTYCVCKYIYIVVKISINEWQHLNNFYRTVNELWSIFWTLAWMLDIMTFNKLSIHANYCFYSKFMTYIYIKDSLPHSFLKCVWPFPYLESLTKNKSLKFSKMKGCFLQSPLKPVLGGVRDVARIHYPKSNRVCSSLVISLWFMLPMDHFVSRFFPKFSQSILVDLEKILDTFTV
jgi:hypothetical protein